MGKCSISPPLLWASEDVLDERYLRDHRPFSEASSVGEGFAMRQVSANHTNGPKLHIQQFGSRRHTGRYTPLSLTTIMRPRSVNCRPFACGGSSDGTAHTSDLVTRAMLTTQFVRARINAPPAADAQCRRGLRAYRVNPLEAWRRRILAWRDILILNDV